MRKIKYILLLLICFLLLFGRKSKEEKANDYLNNKEYKKAYDILYDLDVDHSRADDCLLEWCQYNLTFKVLDSDISSVKFNNVDNAKVIYDKLKDYCKDISSLNKEQINIVESILVCIEDFYKDDSQFVKLKSDLDDQLILEGYYENNEYKKAYDFLYDCDQYHTGTGECLARWYKYCFDNGKIDEDLIDIEVPNTIKLFDVIMEYLNEKVCPTKEQCELVLSVLDKHEDYTMRGIKNFSYIKNSLLMKTSGQYIYDLDKCDSLSYEEYYSSIHKYDENDLNKVSDDIKMYVDSIGLGAARYVGDDITDIQYFLFGDYSDYCWVSNNTSNDKYILAYSDQSSTVSISSRANFDGYWYYYFEKDEDKNIIGLNRLSINNETEEILSESLLENKNILTAFVLDHDVLFTYVEDKDHKIIYRIYLPDMTIDSYRVDIMQQPWFMLIIPEDSDHIVYQTFSEYYYEKYFEIRNDKDKFYNLLVDNGCVVDKDDFYNSYENSINEPNNNQYVLMINNCLKKVYGDDILQQYRYDYDLKNKQLEVTIGNDEIYPFCYK